MRKIWTHHPWLPDWLVRSTLSNKAGLAPQSSREQARGCRLHHRPKHTPKTLSKYLIDPKHSPSHHPSHHPSHYAYEQPPIAQAATSMMRSAAALPHSRADQGPVSPTTGNRRPPQRGTRAGPRASKTPASPAATAESAKTSSASQAGSPAPPRTPPAPGPSHQPPAPPRIALEAPHVRFRLCHISPGIPKQQ